MNELTISCQFKSLDLRFCWSRSDFVANDEDSLFTYHKRFWTIFQNFQIIWNQTIRVFSHDTSWEPIKFDTFEQQLNASSNLFSIDAFRWRWKKFNTLMRIDFELWLGSNSNSILHQIHWQLKGTKREIGESLDEMILFGRWMRTQSQVDLTFSLQKKARKDIFLFVKGMKYFNWFRNDG